MLNEENLISTLEQSLRQTRNAENRLNARLHEVEAEAETLQAEINALRQSAEKTEEAIDSLFSTMRAGNNLRKTKQNVHYEDDDRDYEMPLEPRRYARTNQKNQNNQNNQQSNNYQKGSVSYFNNPRNVPTANRNSEQKNHRFADRTITQACTLLLREEGRSLHVNDLFNLLVEGGFEFKGNNPTISIAVSLNRNRRFRKVAPGTFDLVIRDVSQAAS
ncbi:MAG: hypothetical protein ACR2HG_08805 [Pyrinomonadaceae bacterium]